MKKFLKVLGIIVGAIVLIIILAMVFTSGLTKSANTMFTDIKAGKVEAAYAETAKEFQTATTLDQFKQFLTASKLENFKSASWTERSVENNQGVLKGSIITTDGTVIPLEINLIKEDGSRKVYTVNIPQGGVKNEETGTGTAVVPTQAQTTKLVNEAMGVFATAINKADFTAFYNSISQVWKGQTTAADLQKSFQVFIDNKIDLSFTKTATPEYAATPTVDENGIMTVQGTFTQTEGTVMFEMKFYQESNQWKLFGINVQIK